LILSLHDSSLVPLLTVPSSPLFGRAVPHKLRPLRIASAAHLHLASPATPLADRQHRQSKFAPPPQPTTDISTFIQYTAATQALPSFALTATLLAAEQDRRVERTPPNAALHLTLIAPPTTEFLRVAPYLTS
jgi:hypothetical protein